MYSADNDDDENLQLYFPFETSRGNKCNTQNKQQTVLTTLQNTYTSEEMGKGVYNKNDAIKNISPDAIKNISTICLSYDKAESHLIQSHSKNNDT